MALKTKSIKAPREASDGIRISVMRHHTLNDGVTPDMDVSFDEWWSELGPPSALIRDYHKLDLSREAFERGSISYLTSPRIQNSLRRLIELSRASDVTIMCAEVTPEKSHRRLVAEACRELDPTLEISVK